MDTHTGRRERLRLRVQQDGIESLKAHEVIEYLLYYAVPRVDVNVEAHALIDYFGDVGSVLHAQTEELMRCGLNRRTAEWLCLIGEAALAAGYVRREDNVYLRTFFDVFSYACRLYRRMPSPASLQICMDAEDRVIYQREITPSQSWGEPIVLREAITDVMGAQAQNVIIVQFTGCGVADPDEYDFVHAVRYSDALYAVKCALLDVVLVGEFGSASLRQMDKIPDRRNRTRDTERRNFYLHESPDAAALGLRAYLDADSAQ